MRFGIDIDGTINNFQEIVANYIWKDYGIQVDNTKYELYKGIPQKEVDNFCNRHAEDFLNEVQPLINAKEDIDKLLENNQVFLITARGYDCAKDTLEWLYRYKFLYTDIYFNCGNKVDTCKWKDVDVMVDDSPHNLIALHKNQIPYIIFDQPYNQNIYGELYRAKDWDNLYNFLDFYNTEIN